MPKDKPPNWDEMDEFPINTDAIDILGELLLRLRLLNRIKSGVSLVQFVDDEEILARHLRDTVVYIDDIDGFAEKARQYIRKKNNHSLE